jgi:hypothetical protein
VSVDEAALGVPSEFFVAELDLSRWGRVLDLVEFVAHGARRLGPARAAEQRGAQTEQRACHDNG